VEPAQNFGAAKYFEFKQAQLTWFGTPRLEARNVKIC